MMIAKYRKAEFPGEWWLTDFTMKQVESRIANLNRIVEQLKSERDQLKAENERLRETLEEIRDDRSFGDNAAPLLRSIAKLELIRIAKAALRKSLVCPDALLPDGPICPRCGGRRGPSGVDGGSWVHY